MSSKKIILPISGLLALAGCLSAPDPSQFETRDYKGQTAYIVRASSIFSRGPYDALGKSPLREFEIEAAAKKAETGTHPLALPFQVSATCPGGYRILEKQEPEVSYYMTVATGMPSYRISQNYVVLCQ